MKKITSITIKNYKGYINSYKIDIPNGNNLLIYGENGSGKSSLFHGVENFLISSIKYVPFEKNLFNQNCEGKIDIEFCDLLNGDLDINTKQFYRFSSFVSNNIVDFLKDASLVKGFLDYTDLLKIYLKSEPNPNFFQLIILNLLKDFIPISTGRSTTISATYYRIIADLIKNARTRKSKSHRIALRNLPGFEQDLRTILDQIFIKVNFYLHEYFNLTDIEIGYDLQPLDFYYGNNKREWKLVSDLRLNINKNKYNVGSIYKKVLNEARLSSIALCIYFSSLKLYPNTFEFKLLYLDDIFVGLDTSNRLPVLKLIKDEFPEYQVFISTYDKNFFEVCKIKLKDWKAIELFAGKELMNKFEIDIPIIVDSSNDFEKGCYYLFNKFNPDYPASANYFRKHLEGLVQDYLPVSITKDENFLNIEPYRLTKLLGLTITFLQSINQELQELNNIYDLLSILLHPLSHYEADSSHYKSDLLEVRKNLIALQTNLDRLALKANWKIILEKKMKLRLVKYVDPNNKHIYEFENLDYLFFNASKNALSNMPIFCTYMYNVDLRGIKSNEHRPNKNNQTFLYPSLSTAHLKISEFLVSQEPQLTSTLNYIDNFEVLKVDSWQNLNSLF